MSEVLSGLTIRTETEAEREKVLEDFGGEVGRRIITAQAQAPDRETADHATLAILQEVYRDGNPRTRGAGRNFRCM